MVIFISLFLGLALAAPVLQKPEPRQLLDLLEKPKANTHLIKTIVECIEKPSYKVTPVSFIRCINDQLHIYQKTRFDNIGFILGNFIVKAGTRIATSTKGDMLERATVIGDCLPMLLRNLFGIQEFSFSCRKLIPIDGYDDPDDDDFDEADPDEE